MHAVQSLVGEAHVSRTFRYQGSRPVVVNGVMFDTTGDRLEATDLAENRLLWSRDNAKSEEGERRLTPSGGQQRPRPRGHLGWPGDQL
jgi:hypothetical protein